MAATIYAAAALVVATFAIALRMMHLRFTLVRTQSHGQSLKDQLLDVQNETEFHAIAGKNARDGLVVQTMDGIILWVNDSYCEIMGQRREDVIGRNPLSFALPPHKRPTDAEIAAFRFNPDGPENNVLVLRENIRGDGQIFWNQINATAHKTEDGVYYSVLSCRDVTTQIEKEKELARVSERLAYSAMHDDLTGAANRTKLQDFMQKQAQNAQHFCIGLLQIDLDHFKDINDTHGHEVGDMTLRHASTAMRAALNDQSLLARTGGDEFVAVCIGIDGAEELRAIGEAICQAVRTPQQMNGRNIVCETSIGGVVVNDTAYDLDTLMQQSDYALYEVKRRGRGKVQIYDKALQKLHLRQEQKTSELAQVISAGAMDFHFQPVICTATGFILSFETLARWQHPTRGLLRPDRFMSAVQNLGLSPELDFQAVEAGLKLKAMLDQNGYPDIRVSFNATSATLSHPEFLERVTSSLTRHAIDPATLIVEMPEPDVFDQENTATHFKDRIDALRNLGVTLVLNSFGGGFEGLMRLKNCSVSGFKVDKNVAQSVLDDPACSKIAALVIELGNDLEIKGVLQGVEIEEQARRLNALGAAALQGDWISPALSEHAVLPFVQDWSPSSVIASLSSPRYLRANS